MDHLTLQRNLSTLENRYRELREISESRLQTWEAEKTILKQKIEELNSELSDFHQSDLIRLQLRQAHEELDMMHQELHSTKHQLQMRSLQLEQAQEELNLNAEDLQYLQNWRHELEYSLKSQLKLIRKSLSIRFIEHARWILPTDFLRSNKPWIKSFLRQ
jgi:hypothetical protein